MILTHAPGFKTSGAWQSIRLYPLVEQDLVGVANGTKLFDFAQPTARSMKTDRGGMLATDGRQSLFVWLPLAAKVVHGLRRPGHCRYLFVFRTDDEDRCPSSESVG